MSAGYISRISVLLQHRYFESLVYLNLLVAMETRLMLRPMRPLDEVSFPLFLIRSVLRTNVTSEKAMVNDDNWTGLTDAQARRRRQNRLNQRARRK
jgi:hypothetical protein